MISIENISKSFKKVKALDGVSIEIPERTVYGLVGSNGSGKSTLMRIMMDIYFPDSGRVLCDGKDVRHNAGIRNDMYYIAEEQYAFPHATVGDMARFFASYYKKFDTKEFFGYCDTFEFDKSTVVTSLSKGMRKQLTVLTALAAHPRYLLCDETFDGLDPVARRAVKSLVFQRIEEEGMSVFIASHDLSQIEGMCDSIALLHKGRVELLGDPMGVKGGSFAAIVSFGEGKEPGEEKLKELGMVTGGLEYGSGRIVLRGTEDEVRAKLESLHPEYFRLLPMTLEEIFISEMEVRGYERKIFCGN
ncbi:MAG: ABC transporter ATP-binding protein [Clostridia bacterium]|nr:ABC transporter ATP-binding protein [Clostridia bacterium]